MKIGGCEVAVRQVRAGLLNMRDLDLDKNTKMKQRAKKSLNKTRV